MGIRSCAALFTIGLLQAQDAAPPAFEVASVKPSASGAAGRRTVLTSDAGRISYTGVALGALITRAYDLRNYQLTAPDWVWSERYDLTATFPAGTSERQIPLMLRALLADRFQMVLHREQKELPVYEMTAAKGGIKAAPSEHPAELRISSSSKGRRLTGAASFGALAATLSALLDRPVLDASLTEGSFEIDLEWVPDEREAHSTVGMKVAMANHEAKAPEAGEAPGGGSLFTVLRERLGLKLDPRKSPVEVWTVDRASRIPSEN